MLFRSEHHAVYRKLLNHRLYLSAICEDLPEEHNRVTLDPVLKDSNGIPAPKIDYTISENTRRMMEHAIARASEILAGQEFGKAGDQRLPPSVYLSARCFATQVAAAPATAAPPA